MLAVAELLPRGLHALKWSFVGAELTPRAAERVAKLLPRCARHAAETILEASEVRS